MIRIARPGPGERLPPDHPLRHAELLADAAHLVLEQQPQRLDELHLHVVGKAADVVVRLDRRGDALGAARLDHVAVQRPLHEPLDVAELPRLLLEDADELAADDLALLLRLLDAGEQLEEAVLRLHVDERDVEVLAERLDDLLRLVLAQQSVVDEDARELVADRLVHEQRRDRGVDAAGERAEHALRADLRADALDLLLDHRRRRPRGRRLGDLVEEVLQQLHPVRRVHDLGVELHAVQRPPAVLEGGDRRRRASSPTTRAPSGGATTESRWLIQTVCSRGEAGEERARCARRIASCRTRRRRCGRRGRRGRAPSAACRSRCRASGCRARRCAGRRAARRSAYTDAGPPLRMSAYGLRARTASGEIVCPTSSE